MSDHAKSNEAERAGRLRLHFEDSVDLRLTQVDGLGAKTAEKLTSRGISDLSELLLRFPRKYRRVYRGVSADLIAKESGEYVELDGRVDHVRVPPRHGRSPLEVTVDVEGRLFKLLWFNMNQKWFVEKFRVGRWIRFEGEVEWERGMPRLMHPKFESASGAMPMEPCVELEPVYTSFEGVSDHLLKKALLHARATVLPKVVEKLPGDVRRETGLPTMGDALEMLHLFGDSPPLDELSARLERARERLVFEEFFELQLELAHDYVLARRAARAPICEEREAAREFVRDLPFELTGDQKAAMATIAEELGRRTPMRRLLQGDVGSGKTVVAFMAASLAIASGRQVALMAPTDVLANQHFRKAQEFLGPHGVRLELLTGAMTTADRREAEARIQSGEAGLVIGTHALFQPGVEFAGESSGLGLVIIDEQHKFGVEQRDALLAKGEDPHLLAMSATPIPRSLAHAVFGDLDLTIIKEKPPGRQPVRTFLRDPRAHSKIVDFVRTRVESGEQAYFVYPLVETSENLPARENVLDAAERLANGGLKGLKVGVLHGRMKADEKNSVMERFTSGELQILCSTTVIEVGVDVSNATLMVIEHAELFGLSQLHQLRGRVGRGSAESMCILVARGALTDDARDRLSAFTRSDDGFELSEIDLQIRGPGLFLGARQAGAAEFRFGDVLRDRELLSLARVIARRRVLGDAG